MIMDYNWKKDEYIYDFIGKARRKEIAREMKKWVDNIQIYLQVVLSGLL
jgi:hypothetical protein